MLAYNYAVVMRKGHNLNMVGVMARRQLREERGVVLGAITSLCDAVCAF